MSEEIPQNKLEKKEILEDNARKFTLGSIDSQFLKDHNATSFELIVDWLETGEDNEKKLAYKKFDNGSIQILLISKITKDGNRTSEKNKISEDEYKRLLGSSKLHLEKRRYEFSYNQDTIAFNLKYDEFEDGKLNMLEVDAVTEEERSSFDPKQFPSTLSEVTGNLNYYGYRVAETLK
jgi:hypothetical protein